MSDDLLDNFSKLNKFRQDNGLFRDNFQSGELYIKEQQLRNVILKTIQEKGMKEICTLTGLGKYRIGEIADEITYNLGEAMLKNAFHVYKQDGVISLIRYLDETEK
jgi:hypothetical protein